MHLLDWLIVLLLNGSIIAYGFYLSRGTVSSSEWFLGKRALPWWGIGLSMFATNVDNADIVSVTGKTFTTGLHIISVYAIGSAVGGILAAFVIVPNMYRAGFFTNAEYLEARFGATARVLSAIIQIQYRSSMLGLILYSVFVLLTGLDIMGPEAAWTMIVLLVICSGVYTAWGGLKSVVWTDALQGIVMMLGGLVIFVSVWNAAGGWSGLQTALAQQDAQQTVQPSTSQSDLLHIGKFNGGEGSDAPYVISIARRDFNLGPFLVVIGWMIVGSGYWTVNHTQTMRLLGARSLWDMKMAAVAGIAFSLPIMITIACLGLFGHALPELQNMQQPDQLYPLLVKLYLGVGFKGLVVAGIVAATVSTVDSMGSALSAIFTRDIYARLLVRDRDDQHYLRVGRWATLGVLLTGFLYLPFIMLQRNMLDAFITLIPVLVTPLFTMYLLGSFTRVSRKSGVAGLSTGALYGLFALYCREAPNIEWLPNIEGVSIWFWGRWIAFCWSFVITACTMGIVTCSTGLQPQNELLAVQQTGWLARSSEELPELKEHPFQKNIPWWANPPAYAVALLVLCIYVVFELFW